MNRLRPLTLHELRKMDDEIVWCEELNCNVAVHAPKEGFISVTTLYSYGSQECIKVDGNHYTMYLENPYEDEEMKKSDYNRILDSIGTAACLEQCAEECTELAKATLKLARILRNENYTPVSAEEAIDQIREEAADVRLCLDVLATDIEINTREIERTKLERWLERTVK